VIARWEALLLHASAIVMSVTGGAVALSRYVLTNDDPFSVVGAPWEPWANSAHVVAAPFLVFAVGLVARHHVFGKLRDGRPDGRRSGLSLWLLVVAMIASGYLIQVITHELARSTIGQVHLAVGAAFALLYAGHARLKARPASPIGIGLSTRRESRAPAASRQQPLTEKTGAAHHAARSPKRHR